MNDSYSEDTIAFVYLLRVNDEKNKCLLNQEYLTLIRKNISYGIRLAEITKITFHHKLFLFPIIAGGTFGPFFFIALLSGIFYPAISMTGFIASMAMIYIGFSGKKSFRIETINDVQEVFLPYISENLKEFTLFVNELISGKNKEEIFTFYLPLDEHQLLTLKEKGEHILPEKGSFCIHSKEFHSQIKKEKHPTVKIDFNDPHVQIKFEKDLQGKLQPKAFGKITSDNEVVNSY